jgi:hypothetical protein
MQRQTWWNTRQDGCVGETEGGREGEGERESKCARQRGRKRDASSEAGCLHVGVDQMVAYRAV